MNFNPDTTKQAHEVIFSLKLQNTNHPCSIFNHNTVNKTEFQKYFGLVLGSRWDFKERSGNNFQKGLQINRTSSQTSEPIP